MLLTVRDLSARQPGGLQGSKQNNQIPADFTGSSRGPAGTPDR